jgi:hypothetical protein
MINRLSQTRKLFDPEVGPLRIRAGHFSLLQNRWKTIINKENTLFTFIPCGPVKNSIPAEDTLFYVMSVHSIL